MGRGAVAFLLAAMGVRSAWAAGPTPRASCPGQTRVEDRSGHHFAYGAGRDDALIGWDFGRNPWNPLDPRNFFTPWGRQRLHAALERAVVAGETRVSFDLGFDFRSVILTEGTVRLDDWALLSVQAFLEELRWADQQAQALGGRRFAADVVVADYRIADGVSVEGGLPVGEHPDLITTRRAELMEALRPLFELLGNAVDGNHRLVSLNLMNEPDFVSMSVAEIRRRVEDGRWPLARLGSEPAIDELRAMDPEAFLGVRRVGPSVLLHPTALTPEDVRGFLIAMREVIVAAAPGAEVLVGWADDRSALDNTRRLETQAGHRVTSVVSFHVYPGGHPLTTTRLDFADALGPRPVRIGEWGLGHPSDLGQAIADALAATRNRGFEGVLLWWDDSHGFAHNAYAQALAAFLLTDPVPLARLGDVASLEGHAGTRAAGFPVQFTTPTPAQTSFRYATSGGTATPGVDYGGADAVAAPPACASTYTVEVAQLGDTTPEPHETFGLNVSQPSGLTLLNVEALGTILDDDASVYYTVRPCRLADTRGAPGSAGGPALAANTARSFPVSGVCGVPPEAKAVALIVTAAGATVRGNLRLYPAALPVPVVSAVNFVAGRARAGNGIVLLGSRGELAVRNDMPAESTGHAHVVLDVLGYFSPGPP